MVAGFQGQFRFLSNFWPVEVELEGMTFPSVEHAYQAGKTLSLEWRKRIQCMPTPGKAKRLGRKVPLRPDWSEIKLRVMEDLLRQKFSDPELQEQLGGLEPPLIERNTWHDTFWGICTCGKCPRGENHLGRLLEKIREELSTMRANEGRAKP